MPTVAQPPRMTMMADMVAAPLTDLVALRKICMWGQPIGELRTSSRLPMQNRTAMVMAKPVTPLMHMLIKID